jgi:uncharacterized membrane protein YqjE
MIIHMPKQKNRNVMLKFMSKVDEGFFVDAVMVLMVLVAVVVDSSGRGSGSSSHELTLYTQQ